MLLTFLAVILSTLLTAVSGLEEGEHCSSNKFNGICKLVEECPVIYEQLVAGEPLETLCTFSNHEPVVCCPTGSATSSSSSSSSATPSSILFGGTDRVTGIPLSHQVPGNRAAEKCSEYASSVYTLITPPVLTLNREPVNTSLCGVGSSPTLIIGGTKAEPKKYPHMAAVGYNGQDEIVWLCGGTLISDRYVLTAAHCLRSAQWGSVAWVKLGEQNLKRDDDGARPKIFRVVEKIRHPRYRSPSAYNDIALLKLEKKVQFDAWIRPACLPTDSSDPELAVATGWGRVDWTDSEGSEDLLQVTLTIVSNSRCNHFYRDDDYRLRDGIDPDSQLCAGEEGKDTCQGDSGGPLAIFNKRHHCMYDVIGVTSLGRFCGSIVPGVYTRVSHFIPWIEDIVWP